MSERIRALVKDPALAVAPRAEALLYAAARAQLVQELLAPLLERGTLVLLDRFVDSSLAYQGAGRELGVEEVRAINLVRHRRPDARPHAAAAHRPGAGRARASASARTSQTGWSARTSGSSRRIAAAYDELAREEPERIRPIDAGQPPQDVLRDALAAIEDLL